MTKRYQRPLTPEEFANLSDVDIDYSDIPELDEEFIRHAYVVAPDTQPVAKITLDEWVVDFFKERYPHNHLAVMASILGRYAADRLMPPKTPEVLPKVQELIAKHIELRKCAGTKQRDIAVEAGYDQPNNISMLKTGVTKVPFAKVPALSKALGIDPIILLRAMMYEYYPEWRTSVEDIVGGLTTKAEREILSYIREKCGQDELILTEDIKERLKSAFEPINGKSNTVRR